MATTGELKISGTQSGPYLGDPSMNLNTLRNAHVLMNGIRSVGALTALAGGGQTNATQLSSGMNQVDTVATTADSCQLPAAISGTIAIVINAGANSTTVFGKSGRTDTINGTAGATGVAQAASAKAFYICAEDGAWFTIRAST